MLSYSSAILRYQLFLIKILENRLKVANNNASYIRFLSKVSNVVHCVKLTPTFKSVAVTALEKCFSSMAETQDLDSGIRIGGDHEKKVGSLLSDDVSLLLVCIALFMVFGHTLLSVWLALLCRTNHQRKSLNVRTVLMNNDKSILLQMVLARDIHKHWNPKFKWFRTKKVIEVELPDYHKKEKEFSEMTPEEMRTKYKEMGIQPPRHWRERYFFISCSSAVFEPYVPPEGDGKVSVINSAGAKQKLELLKKKTTSWKNVRKIREFEENFELYPDFVDAAQEIYIKSYESIVKGDKNEINEYITERALPEVLHNIKNKTVRWKYIKSVEPPKVAHVRVTDLVSKENLFAQITVRFHSQQTLAIYDRFGRLIHGSEILAKDVLEYVVFEKHISNQYGTWRIHDKIIPDWMPPASPLPRTFVKPHEEVESAENEVTQAEATPDVAIIKPDSSSNSPQLAAG